MPAKREKKKEQGNESMRPRVFHSGIFLVAAVTCHTCEARTGPRTPERRFTHNAILKGSKNLVALVHLGRILVASGGRRGRGVKTRPEGRFQTKLHLPPSLPSLPPSVEG